MIRSRLSKASVLRKKYIIFKITELRQNLGCFRVNFEFQLQKPTRSRILIYGVSIKDLFVAGVLSMLGKADSPPFPPVNVIADFAGGGLLTAMGICAALLERAKSGKGQVIDTSMVSMFI